MKGLLSGLNENMLKEYLQMIFLQEINHTLPVHISSLSFSAPTKNVRLSYTVHSNEVSRDQLKYVAHSYL